VDQQLIIIIFFIIIITTSGVVDQSGDIFAFLAKKSPKFVVNFLVSVGLIGQNML